MADLQHLIGNLIQPNHGVESFTDRVQGDVVDLIRWGQVSIQQLR